MPTPPYSAPKGLGTRSFLCLNHLTQPHRILAQDLSRASATLLSPKGFRHKIFPVPKPPCSAPKGLGTRSFLCLNHLTQPHRILAQDLSCASATLLSPKGFRHKIFPVPKPPYSAPKVKPPYSAPKGLGTRSFLCLNHLTRPQRV